MALNPSYSGEPHGCIDEGGSPQNGNSTIPARKPCGWTLSDVAVRTGCVGSTSETGLASRRGGKAFRSQTLYGPFVVLLKAASYTEIPLLHRSAKFNPQLFETPDC